MDGHSGRVAINLVDLWFESGEGYVHLSELARKVGGWLVLDELRFVESYPERNQAGPNVGLLNVLIGNPGDKPLLSPVEDKGFPLPETFHPLYVQPVPVEKLRYGLLRDTDLLPNFA